MSALVPDHLFLAFWLRAICKPVLLLVVVAPKLANIIRKCLLILWLPILVDVSIFFSAGGGEGGVRSDREGGGLFFFLLKIPGGGGERAGRVFAGNGGGTKYFFRGRNARKEICTHYQMSLKIRISAP